MMSGYTDIVVRNCALVAILTLIIGLVTAEDLMLNVNVKRPLAVVSEKFLSVTLDPIVLFNTDMLSDIERSANMARALAPAYVRIGGPRSNSYVFERGLYPQERRPEPGFAFTGSHWIDMHKWAEKSGLDVIACLAPQLSDNRNSWDPRNALDLISFSDHLGYNTSWQLGYECQTRCEVSGSELGREVLRLRSMLDAFPRYSNAATNGGLLVGPDVVSFKTRQDQQYLLDYFNTAGSALTAVTWHPDFAGISLEAEGVSMHHDDLAIDKDSFYRVAGRQVLKKPLWIAESKPEECKQQFLGALVWARRLGNTAKLGIQVLMRQPENSNLFKPTPDYWVSVLHKMLVGREVLDTRIAAGNRTHVSFYSQCTRPSSQYEKGSLTIFGINLTPTKITASVKGLKPKVVHKYILLPGFDAPNRMFAETTLLNNELLTLVGGKKIPNIQPVVYSAEKGVKLKLPSGGIGFWVLPGLKIKTCMEHEEDTIEKNFLKRITKQLDDAAAEDESEKERNPDRESTKHSIISEEQKFKQQQLQQQIEKRLPSRRGDRHRVDQRNDLGESRKLRMSQLELAKRELEKLNRIMQKRDSQYIKRKNENIKSNFDNSEEEESASTEESILKKSIASLKIEDSGKEILAKLQEYKKRLDNEAKKRQSNATTEPAREDKDSNKKVMDTEKVIEALTLITKVENALEWLERETENRTNDSTLTLNNGDSKVGTTDLHVSGSSDSLLDEILNSEKSKNSNVPTGIEDQLKALYLLLSEEKEKKDNESRLRRDLEQRKLHSQQQKDNEDTMLESEENDFYGFETQPPLENFPEGDVYMQASIDSVESGGQQQQIPRSRTIAVTRVPIINDEDEAAWIEDGQSGYMPNEFYEETGRQIISTRPNVKNYADMWEADSINKNVDNIAETIDHKIVSEMPVPEANSGRAKKQTSREVNYYPAGSGLIDYDYGNSRHSQQQMQYQSQANPDYHRDPTAKRSNVYNPGPIPTAYQNAGGYYTQSTHSPVDETSYRRTKRHINDLESVLDQEMLTQDVNNLKDCQCRVIRGLEECKDCLTDEELESSMVVIPAPTLQNPLSNAYINSYRLRRDAEETTTQEDTENIESSTCLNEGTEEIPMTTEAVTDAQRAEQFETVKEEVVEKIVPDLKEVKSIEEPLTTTVKDELKLEGDSEKIAGNRLPRTVGSSPKSFLKKRASKSKENSEDQPEINSPADSPNTGIAPITKTDPKTVGAQQVTNTAIKEVTDSLQIKASNKNKGTKPSKENKVEQPYPIESDNVKVESKQGSTVEKSSKSDLTTESKDKRAVKTKTLDVKNKPIENKSTRSSVSIKPDNIKNSTTSTKTAKINATGTESKNKLKNISSGKSDDLNKSRPARLTTRAEALAALKKENETKRTKKMIETSLKILNSENAKFEEFQRKRREQLEKLKIKLRAKREKMLKQYRAELIEAIKEDSDGKTRKIRRRDVSTNSKDTVVEAEKKSNVEFVVDVTKPSLETHDKEPSEIIETIVDASGSNSYGTYGSEKHVAPIDVHFKDEMYDMNDQEYESTNRKRSPYPYVDRLARSRSYNSREPWLEYATSGEDSLEYYSPPRQPRYRQTNQYYPQVIYNKDGVVPSAYDSNYYQPNPVRKQQDYTSYHKKAINLQKKNDENGAETTQQPLNENKFNSNQEKQETEKIVGSQGQQSEDQHQPSQQKRIQYEIMKPNNRKARRSNMKIFEIDPSMYEDEDPGYLQRSYVKPSHGYSSRNYRDTHGYGSRYKRETDENAMVNGPLSFSLGLEKSKMKEMTNNIGSSMNILARKRREVEDFSPRNPINKNIKKVLKGYDEKNKKIPKGLIYTQAFEKKFDGLSESSNQHKSITIAAVSKNTLPMQHLDIDNHFENQQEKQISKRNKRSIEKPTNDHEGLILNSIDQIRSDDSEMDAIWNNIIEMKQDEKLLQEYDKQKGKIIDDYKETQRNLKKYFELVDSPFSEEQNATSNSTTQTNIESILVEAIPKIETVITGGLKKAQNISGPLEDFIETFDEEFEDTTVNSQAVDPNTEVDTGRLSNNVFRAMIGSVNRFFHLISGLAKALQS